MAASDDSRAFTVLKQNAEDFKASFDEDITQCLAVLDSKITELLCDQESSTLAFGEAKMLNAHMLFSKAKLDIFVSMKSLLNQIETSWVEQLAELKETFIENIEIFLAGTKLEVKEDTLSRGTKKALSSLKGRKGYQNSPSSSTVSSLYPSLKSIELPKDLVPEDEVLECEQDAEPISQNMKPIQKLSASPVMRNTPDQNARRKNSVRFMEVVENTETIDVEDEEIVVETPVQKRRGRKPAAATPASLKKAPNLRVPGIEITENDTAPVATPVRSGRGIRKSVLNTPTSLKKNQALTPVRRRNAAEIDKDSSDSSNSGIDQPAQPEARTLRGAKTLLPTDSAVNVTPGRKKRTAVKRGVKAAVPEPVEEMETSESDNNVMQSPAGPKTPKNVHFSLGLDVNEDLEIYSPHIDLTRSAPRRKTTVNAALDPLPDIFLTPDVLRSKSKRKTIASHVSDMTVAPSPKRFKKNARNSIAPSALAIEVDANKESDLLDSDEASGKDNYTQWIPLSDVGAKAPSQPGVYELKVPQAKKSAYIGGCANLRQVLTLHKLKQTTGHKHLDKFVDRNAANILVRYEKMASLSDAKLEEKNRVGSFVTQYNTTPAFN